MAKDKSQRGRPSIGRQFGVRLPDSLIADLEFVAETTGNDVSSVIRTILTENIGRHVRQANQIREDREQRPPKGKGKSA